MTKNRSGARKTKRSVRMPATKFAHLRKQMQQISAKTGKQRAKSK